LNDHVIGRLAGRLRSFYEVVRNDGRTPMLEHRGKHEAATPNHRIRVWDIPTRLFHWLTAGLVLAAYVTWRLDLMAWHARVGEAALALVIFRLLWGIAGSDTARFSSFAASPLRALHHLAHVFRREPDRQAGHNPAGALMVLLLLALLVGETLSGLYVQNDVADHGRLTDIVPARIANGIDAAHWILWDALLAAVALHVLAIAIYAAAKGHNLVAPMITGRKRLPANVPQPRMASALRAAILLGVSVLATAALVAMM
jgi:cytochrome b